jgi:hypothetical protein
MDKAKLLKEFSQLLDEIETLEKTASGFYDYEKGSVELLTKMSKDVIEQGIGKASGDYRKKKL